MKRFLDGLVIIGIGYCFFSFMSQRKQITEFNNQRVILTDSLKKMKKNLDSLNSEVFTKDIEISRYEIIIERAEDEMSPECKKELESIKKTVE